MVSLDGEEYVKARNRLGLTQVETEDLSGVSRRVIQKIEASNQTVSPSSRRKVAVALGMIPDSQEFSIDHGSDAFWHLPGIMFDHVANFTKQRKPSATRCTRIQEAESTVQRMRENWKLHLSQVCDLNQNSRLQKVDRMLDERSEEYIDRYVRIWHKVPESLMCSTAKGVRTGGSIVLPVSDQAYDQLVAGERGYMDIQSNDICPGSPNLIFDTLVEFLDAPKTPWYDITHSLSATVFYQAAALAGDVTSPKFRAASFEASPVNAKRLRSVGFVPNGRKTAEYQFPIYEIFSRLESPNLNKSSGPLVDDTRKTSVFFSGLLRSKLGKNSNGPTLNTRARRRAVISALSMYQKVLGRDSRSTKAA